MIDCAAQIITGDIIGAMVCPFTNIIGPWFYVLVLAVIEIAIYMKYDNLLAPSLMGTIVSLMMINLLPAEVWSIPAIMLAANFCVAIYAAFVKPNW